MQKYIDEKLKIDKPKKKKQDRCYYRRCEVDKNKMVINNNIDNPIHDCNNF